MSRRRHALLVLLALLLAVCAVAGQHDVALTFGPVLLLASLLVIDRFPGAELIVARRLARSSRPRPVPALWPRRRGLVFASLLERSAHTLRGPPAVA
jgi:hypothetical protein